MDIRSFFKRKDPAASATIAAAEPKVPPVTPSLKTEDAKRKSNSADVGGGATVATAKDAVHKKSKIQSSPEVLSQGESTCIGSSKEPRSRLSHEGSDGDLESLLDEAVGVISPCPGELSRTQPLLIAPDSVVCHPSLYAHLRVASPVLTRSRWNRFMDVENK